MAIYPHFHGDRLIPQHDLSADFRGALPGADQKIRGIDDRVATSQAKPLFPEYWPQQQERAAFDDRRFAEAIAAAHDKDVRIIRKARNGERHIEFIDPLVVADRDAPDLDRYVALTHHDCLPSMSPIRMIT